MVTIKALTGIEIGLLAVAVVGAPFIQVFMDEVVYPGTYDPDQVTTSLYFKTGDTITLTIESYTLNYTVQGNITNFLIEPAIYTAYSIVDFTDAGKIHEGSSTTDTSYNFDVNGVNRTHANCTVRETGYEFQISIPGIIIHFPAYPYLAPGIKITAEQDPSDIYMAWFPVPVFSPDKTREALDYESRDNDSYNGYQKIDANTYRYPNDRFLEKYYYIGKFSIPQSIITWTLQPRSSRIVAINAYHPIYIWNSTFPFFRNNNIVLEAWMSLNLTLAYN